MTSVNDTGGKTSDLIMWGHLKKSKWLYPNNQVMRGNRIMNKPEAINLVSVSLLKSFLKRNGIERQNQYFKGRYKYKMQECMIAQDCC